jgi:hypothetical protein
LSGARDYLLLSDYLLRRAALFANDLLTPAFRAAIAFGRSVELA